MIAETDLPGTLTATFPVESQDLPAISDALSKEFEVTLTRAKRQIEMVVLSASP